METKYRLRVAIFTLFGLAILIAGYMWFTDYRINLNRFYYDVEMEDVSWLERGDIVTLMGVNVGRVERLRIEEDRVIVTFFLDGVKIRKGAKIFAENQGFLGRKRLVIKQGKGEILEPGKSVLRGYTSPDLGDLIARSGEILEMVKNIINKIDATTEDLNNAFTELTKSLLLLSSDFKKTSVSLRKFAGKGEEIYKTIQKINDVALNIESITRELKENKGTLQRLIRDESLYEQIDTTLKSLNSLIEDIKKNPKKYIKLSIF